MNRLKEKLKSEDGASLLLALLVFLLCIMAAVSVLAATVSNAGKARSRRVEQQRYQTLSSAVRLICGELEKVEYTGTYAALYTWKTGSKDYFCYKQLKDEADIKITMQSGYESQTFKFAEFAFINGNLKKEMDDVFRGQFQKEDGSGDVKEGYYPLEDTDVITAEGAAANPILLSVTLPDGLAGYPYATGSIPFEEYKIPKKVRIQIKMDHTTGDIELTAWLDDSEAVSPPAGSGIMVAELTAVEIGLDTLDPEGEPGEQTEMPSGTPVKEGKTAVVRWKLESMSMTTAL